MKKILMCVWVLFLATFMGMVQAADVLLGPGDIIKVSVYGHSDLALETRISESGTITFPLVGEVGVGGLNPSAAEKKVAALLEKGGYLKNPQVNIIVTLLQSQQVSVLGLVNKPGRYPIDGKRSLTDVLALAGGVHSEGGDTITLIRTKDGKTEKQTIDMLDMVRSADMNQNIELLSNDVIYVERAPKFYVYGEVQRPGPYRLERNMTVLQAISIGGGLTPRGTERGIRLKRRDAEGVLRELEVKQDDSVRADDVIYVQESLF